MIVEELFLKANFIVNPIIQETLANPMILKNEIIKKAINEGLYFITDEENADKIIEESLINSPEPFLSYGLKKPIFYGGIPDLAVSCHDLKLPKTLVAIKLTIPYETLALFQMEHEKRYYKLSYPNYLIEPFALKKVYLGLNVDEDKKFAYREITEEQSINYEIKIPLRDVKEIEKNLAKELKEKVKKIKKQKNRFSK